MDGVEVDEHDHHPLALKVAMNDRYGIDALRDEPVLPDHNEICGSVGPIQKADHHRRRWQRGQ
ncbi:hypothetical protein [Microbacterium nanhaiense]|uniref:hypothetical protein n=1 Tax=Microbacterium nanhaiense TaxID=1301026 RepID=UPI0016640EBF|nr:hypothetical protein [Microbacterium nanhaiense]